MAAGLVTAVTSALDCVVAASMLENYDSRLTEGFSISSGYQESVKPLTVSSEMTPAWLQEVDRLLVDTVHCAARFFKISPTEVLVAAARETTVVFQRILIAL